MKAARSLMPNLLTALGAVVALGACIGVPDEEKPQCERASDCDQPAGEICEEGVCWGDPPRAALALIVGPPAGADDLVPAENPMLVIPSHGFLSDLVLGIPVTIKGRVLRECAMPCTPTPVQATLRITRPSSFPGGPGLTIIEETDSAGAFTLHLPLTHSGETPYSITLSPKDRGAARPTLFAGDAEEVPPQRMTLIADRDTTITLTMPTVNLPVVSGRLLDGNGNGIRGYRMVARGRWSADEPMTEVSTVAITAADGSYQLALADQLVGEATVRAEPPMAGSPAATLEMEEIDVVDGQTGVDLRLPAGERPAVPLTMTVRVPDGGGEMPPVKGVTVRVQYELRDPGSPQLATYSVAGTTDEDGLVSFYAIPGAGAESWTYRLSMVPQADSLLAAVFDQPLVIGNGGPLAVPPLARRVSITGVLTTGTRAMKDVTVTVRPSRTFLQQLDDERRTFVHEIAATTTTTSKNGEFVAWADPMIAGVPARYSLSFQPPESQFHPSWTHVEEVSIPTLPGTDSVDVGTVFTVEAANIRGRVTNPGGRPVAKAIVAIYKLDYSCLTAGCSGTAEVIGRGVADDDGMIRISLPKE
jgi:hypothetical protein